MKFNWNHLKATVVAFAFLGCFQLSSLTPQQLDSATVVQGIDASVRARIDNVAGYSVTEHYAVFRSQDETHPAAEMIVRTVYRKGSGKSYTVLSQTGSSLLRSEVLGTLLENEKRMSQPGNVETALIDSANYDMKLTSDPHRGLEGRDCLVVSLSPRRSSPFLFKGTLWVDARDYAIVQLEGTASKSPFFSGECRAGVTSICRRERISNGDTRKGGLEQHAARPNRRKDRLQRLPDRASREELNQRALVLICRPEPN